jgi:hypothetical protein
MPISARFVELSKTFGSPAAAARELKFPIHTFVRIASGLPVRPGSLALAEKRLADFDAAQLLRTAPTALALSTLPAAGDLPAA